MIWHGENGVDGDRYVLQDHVTGMLNGLAVQLGEDDQDLSELAFGVSSYCLSQTRGGHVPDSLLQWGMARALHTLGRKSMAQALIAEGRYAGRSRQEYDVLLSGGSELPDLWRSCAAKVVRPMPLAAFPGHRIWIVDLDRVEDASCVTLDLAVLGVLRRLVSALAGLWDGADGQGVLGVLAGGAPEQAARFDEWAEYIRAALQREQDQRGWASRPDVVRIDLPVRRRKKCRTH